MTDAIIAAKQELRRTMGERRAAIDTQARQGAAAALTALAMSRIDFGTGAIVAGYFPVRGEFDVLPLMQALARSGHSLALPVVTGAAQALAFRRYAFGDALVENRFGIAEPAASAPALDPTHLLVPLLAFDSAGYRLGYGGGYYDRSLAVLRGANRAVTAIGIGFDLQLVPRLPLLPTDQPLDLVASEHRLYGPQAAGNL